MRQHGARRRAGITDPNNRKVARSTPGPPPSLPRSKPSRGFRNQLPPFDRRRGLAGELLFFFPFLFHFIHSYVSSLFILLSFFLSRLPFSFLSSFYYLPHPHSLSIHLPAQNKYLPPTPASIPSHTIPRHTPKSHHHQYVPRPTCHNLRPQPPTQRPAEHCIKKDSAAGTANSKYYFVAPQTHINSQKKKKKTRCGACLRHVGQNATPRRIGPWDPWALGFWDSGITLCDAALLLLGGTASLLPSLKEVRWMWGVCALQCLSRWRMGLGITAFGQVLEG